jgi:type IV pilus assembly protein PilN
MKIAINLASQPFRRDRAMLVASVLVCCLLVVTLGVLTELAIQDNRQLGDARRGVAGLKQQIQAIAVEQAKLDAVVHKPENETVLERSVFINTLLQRKGLSWNQIFNDLEKTLPYNVKLVSIRPSVDNDGQITLDMTMAAEAAGPVEDAFRAFHASPLFGAAVIKDLTSPTQTQPLYSVAISVTYAQKL